MTKYCILICLLSLLICCKEKSYGFAKAKITKIEYKTVGRGYYRTKFICRYKYQGKEVVGYALGQTHFCAIPECSVDDSILIKFDKDIITESVVIDIFYRNKNIHGDYIDNTYYRGKYNQLE